MAENPSLTYALQPAKLYVCASYSGDPQDAAAAPFAERSRKRPSLRASRWFRARTAAPRRRSYGNGARNSATPTPGALAYAMESNAPSWVSVDGNPRVCVEVRREARVYTKGGNLAPGPGEARLVGPSLEGRREFPVPVQLERRQLGHGVLVGQRLVVVGVDPHIARARVGLGARRVVGTEAPAVGA